MPGAGFFYRVSALTCKIFLTLLLLVDPGMENYMISRALTFYCITAPAYRKSRIKYCPKFSGCSHKCKMPSRVLTLVTIDDYGM